MSPFLQFISLFLFFSWTDNFFVDDYARFSTLDTKEKSTAVANSMNYMTKKGERQIKTRCWIILIIGIKNTYKDEVEAQTLLNHVPQDNRDQYTATLTVDMLL